MLYMSSLERYLGRSKSLLGEGVGVFIDFFEELLILEVKEDSGFFYFSGAEDLFYDFFASEGAISLLEDLGDDFGDGAAHVAPRVESVNPATDEDEAGIFDKFVMNGLDGDIFAAKIGIFDGVGNVSEVHWFFFGFEDDVNFVADIFRVDGRPFGKTPKAIERSEKFRDGGDGADMVGMFVVELHVEFVESHGFFIFLDDGDYLVDSFADFGGIAILDNTNSVIITIVFIDDG